MRDGGGDIPRELERACPAVKCIFTYSASSFGSGLVWLVVLLPPSVAALALSISAVGASQASERVGGGTNVVVVVSRPPPCCHDDAVARAVEATRNKFLK